MFRKLLPCIGKYKKYAILTPIFVVIEVVLEVFIPFLMSKIVDVGIKNSDVEFIIRTGFIMVIMAILALGFGALHGRFAAVASVGFAKGVRKKLFDKIQDFSFSNIDKFTTPSLVTRLTTDVTNTQHSFMMVIRILVRAPIMLISATIISITINPDLSLIFLFAIPLLGFTLYFVASNAFPRFKMMLKAYDKMNASVQENLIAIRTVKAFVREDFENDKFIDAADTVRLAQKKAEKLIVWTMPVMQFVMYACIMAVSWFGGNMIINQRMTSGELLSYITYSTQILVSLMMISFVFVNIVLSRASISRILEIFDEKIDIDDKESNNELTVKNGSIVFDNVSFSYSKDKNNLTLESCNFTVKSGETIGIIGGTGSSKTTLVQLIPRLYDVLEGRILVGGHDVKEYSLKVLRDAVAMVLQKNVLFSGTIKENLKWGNENATDEEIIEACKIAQAYDFIMSFPNGFETELGQGGVNLSGGQKQRLTIARALLKKPKILILDDSTSAVDTETDRKIRHNLKENVSDTTVIIIAQRISSVSDADKIIVLDDGKINAIGTHEELLKTNSIYKEVYESQKKGVA
ncbi:MAG: ABC transporter ATP-binding protein [Clostridiaceae bacterium]|nr:ABC transporter ATP-binding protein [Clostridiaceae bacterium]